MFYSNKIQHVGEGLLDGLQNLYSAIFENEVCIYKNANNPSEIPALIEALRQNCTDIETTTTTTISPPRCDINDFEDFACRLDEEIENLRDENENLKENVENLTENVENLNQQNQEMREKLENQAEVLLQLEQMVIELYSRPCAC
jgi:chromosome segregation ATPase